jgi:tRNA acetyltransferase TAN1
MSVVGSDWEKLKRFNLAELYQPSSKAAAVKAEAIPQSVTTDEGPPTAIS